MGSVPALDEVTITANFDRRVEDGTIIYDQNYQTVKYLDDGFSVRTHTYLTYPFHALN